MTLQQIKYIVAVADTNSMNEAAKDFYISADASSAIKDLEAEININIFTRTNKGASYSRRGRF